MRIEAQLGRIRNLGTYDSLDIHVRIKRRHCRKCVYTDRHSASFREPPIYFRCLKDPRKLEEFSDMFDMRETHLQGWILITIDNAWGGGIAKST